MHQLVKKGELTCLMLCSFNKWIKATKAKDTLIAIIKAHDSEQGWA